MLYAQMEGRLVNIVEGPGAMWSFRFNSLNVRLLFGMSGVSREGDVTPQY